MNHSSITPVFTALRIGLHSLVTGLALFVIVQAIVGVHPDSSVAERTAVIVVAGAFLAVYASAGPFSRRLRGDLRFVWLGVLTILWVILSLLTPFATFLAFPMFFLFLHLLHVPWSIIATACATVFSIIGFSGHSGWNIGAIVGPIIGAAVALGIGLGYRALYREVQERESLIADLRATREQLAVSEREAGTLAERTRLARELHDTVAQGLASIQLLLHAAQRSTHDEKLTQTLALAQETAAANLAETRRFIHELTPPILENQSLAAALRRLAETTTRSGGPEVTAYVVGVARTLPMPLETALLRIAQGSLANVVTHASARTATVVLSYDDDVCLDIIDDGIGFVPRNVLDGPQKPGSFGLSAIRSRVFELGGTVSYQSEPGAGTTVTVCLPTPAPSKDTQ